MRDRHRILVLLALSAFPLAAHSAQQPAPVEPGDEARYGSLSGRVLNAVTGDPIGGAQLLLESVGRSREFAVTAAADGSYRFHLIEPGRYYLQVRADGFVTNYYGDSLQSRQPLLIEAGREIAGLEIRLTPAGAISGRIEDEAGRPVARVSVSLFIQQTRKGKVQWEGAGVGKCSGTDDRGEYRCFFLEPGRYLVAADPESLRHVSKRLAAPSASSSAENAPARLAYLRTYFPGVVRVADAVPLDVLSGKELTGINIRLARVPVFTIRGRVLDGATGRPLSDTGVHMRSLDEPQLLRAAITLRNERQEFEFPMVSPGRYELETSSGSRRSKLQVTVGSEDLTGLELVLRAGVLVRGRVVPRPSIDCHRFRPWTAGGLEVVLDAVGREGDHAGEIKPDGSFEIPDVPPGEYRLDLLDIQSHCFAAIVGVSGTVLKTRRITVPPGGLSGIEIYPSAVATVTGIVRDEAGNPVVGARVICVGKDDATGNAVSSCGISVTDHAGNFEHKYLYPRTVRFAALRSFNPDKPLPAAVFSMSTEVKLTENGKHTQDLTVIFVEQ